MNPIEKYQTVVVIAAIAGGILLGQISGIPAVAEQLILPFLLVMLLGAFLQIPLTRLRKAFSNRRVVGLSLVVNFVWNPLFAVGLGFVFLRGHPALWVGLIMLMVTPCTDWYLIFTDIARGDVSLATSLLPYNLVLQLVLLPVYLYAFAGELVVLPLGTLVESVLLVLVIPLVLAAVGRATLPRVTGNSYFEETLLPALGPAQILFLALAIAAMFASQGAVILENPGLLLLLAIPVVVFYVVNFVLGLGIGRLADFSYREVACFNCTILSRNSPTALAIAVVAFPNEPLIPLALVIGPLLELPLLSVASQLLLQLRERDVWETATSPSSGD
ncbi:arsenic resistance protein [Natrialba asiatica]|uniref:Bile acid:sodium symporter n=1 Tax=Natrialba asiatica (strain ATCC 700177 / DSM 12278 / JCM 9576 / FERM P-10747 / NBRC 102637 / 172P1) TaxID=29540 RepID=M0AR22_NATA1|nr:arsenic resistance protein [Natrialba asiatica]ELZ00388.1 Bile acid:sodium symporter [Natrialba asiatica DSM 12278]